MRQLGAARCALQLLALRLHLGERSLELRHLPGQPGPEPLQLARLAQRLVALQDHLRRRRLLPFALLGCVGQRRLQLGHLPGEPRVLSARSSSRRPQLTLDGLRLRFVRLRRAAHRSCQPVALCLGGGERRLQLSHLPLRALRLLVLALRRLLRLPHGAVPLPDGLRLLLLQLGDPLVCRRLHVGDCVRMACPAQLPPRSLQLLVYVGLLPDGLLDDGLEARDSHLHALLESQRLLLNVLLLVLQSPHLRLQSALARDRSLSLRSLGGQRVVRRARLVRAVNVILGADQVVVAALHVPELLLERVHIPAEWRTRRARLSGPESCGCVLGAGGVPQLR